MKNNEQKINNFKNTHYPEFLKKLQLRQTAAWFTYSEQLETYRDDLEVISYLKYETEIKALEAKDNPLNRMKLQRLKKKIETSKRLSEQEQRKIIRNIKRFCKRIPTC